MLPETIKEQKMADRTAVVIGVGAVEGLGSYLCQGAAREGLHTFIGGRTSAKIEAVADVIRADGGEATAVVTDTTDEASVTALIEATEAEGPIDLAIYNAGNNMPGRFLEMEASYFEECWRVTCYGGFLFAREALKKMVPRGTGTLLMTGASASLRGRQNFAAFTAAKAGLRTLSQSLAREFGPQGIHVGHTIVDGAIGGDLVKERAPEWVENLGEDGLVGLQGIAESYMFMYRQPRNAWTHELDLRPHKENW